MLSCIMTLAEKKHELTPYMFGSSSERGNGLLTTAQTVTSHKPFRARVLACWATSAEKPPSELIALLLQWSMAQTGARKLWCDRTRRKKMVFFSLFKNKLDLSMIEHREQMRANLNVIVKECARAYIYTNI